MKYFVDLLQRSAAVFGGRRHPIRIYLLLALAIGMPGWPWQSFARELEINWTSTSSTAVYPSPANAIRDIHNTPGWPGSELARPCPEKDYDPPGNDRYSFGYCVVPEAIPLDLRQSGLLYRGAYGGIVVGCSICPQKDAFGVTRCTADQTYYCKSEDDVKGRIGDYYSTSPRYCNYEFGDESAWLNPIPEAAGEAADGTQYYAVKFSKTLAVNYWPLYDWAVDCSDPRLPTEPNSVIWNLGSLSYKKCETGYYGFDGVSCLNHFEAKLKQLGAEQEQAPGQCPVGNPCHPTTGVKSLTEPDFRSPTLELTRYYQSQMYYRDHAAMGRGWSHNYSERILPFAADAKRHIDGRGHVERYHCVDAPACALYRAESKPGYLLRPITSGWELQEPGGGVKTFDSAGRLVQIEQRGKAYRLLRLTYTADDAVDAVTDQQGRSLKFNYNADGLVESVTLPSGESIHYRYDRPADVPTHVGWNQRLVKVVREDLSERVYHYEDQNADGTPRGEFLVTGITDENGVRYATYAYDDHARPVSSEHAGGAGRVTLNYTHRPGETENWTVTEVTRPLGEVETYAMAADPYRKPTAIDDSRGAITFSYDPGTTWRSSRTDRGGNVTRYSYGDGLHQTRRTEAAGTLDERTIETDWDNAINRVTQRREPGRITDYTYNSRGQVLTRTETDVQTFAARSWTTSYYEVPSLPALIGKVRTLDGPRIDVADLTQYDYYTNDDPDGRYLTGDLHTVTDALGHVTEYLQYDGNGRPLEIRDPNGAITALEYDVRGWIVARAVDGQTTFFTHDSAGNLTGIIQPDGSYTRYEYDDAHRLIAVSDNLGNRIEYTLDAAGNRVAENTYNDQAVLRRRLSRIYDQLNRLQKVIDGNLGGTVYGYDDNGNRTSTRDANTNTTTFEYDALDRLVRTIDAGLGESVVTFDARDNRTSVSDPLGNLTVYEYDGLDNQTRLDSPDAGATVFEYDAAGNRTAATDARGVRVEYRYDALNRLKLVDYADDSLDVMFTYDMGVNGVGRLTGMKDAAGGASYSYDARGNLTAVTRVTDGASYRIGYTYNGADRLTRIVYPSGMAVDYALDEGGRVMAVDKTVNGVIEPLVTDIRYEPFGPVSAFSFGNGLAMSALFDQDYRLARLQSGKGLDWSFAHDPAGNVLDITDKIAPANSQTFTYDDVYRLTNATGGYGNELFDYDANGNRTRYVNDVTDEAYTYQPQSNRLAAQGGWTFDRDAAGNRLDKLDSNGHGQLLSYADNNRMARVTYRGVTGEKDLATYVYDGRGQRVGKIAGGLAKRFVYGLNGELLGEYRADGSVSTEYVYLNGRPIAVYSQRSEVSVPPPVETIIDNDDPGTGGTGAWNVRTDSQQYGTDYREAKNKGLNTWRWPVAAAGAGPRDVYVRWVDGKSYSDQAEYTISYAGGSLTDVVTIDQKSGGGQWRRLGTYNFAGTESEYVELSVDRHKASADAVRLVANNDPVVIRTERTDFVHTDHLGTPRAVTDATGTVVWRWDSRPFGDSPANEDPDGDGIGFTLNLRFPGQYYDTESGLHYNYFRDYDPRAGRYVESDPIGLEGGINSYAYAANNPIINLDFFGLYQMCHRPVQGPIPGRHCYALFSDGSTSSFSNSGVGSEKDTQNRDTQCTAKREPQKDRCIREAMKKCEGSYNFIKFNCCHCVEQALKECGTSIPIGDWPNYPINPGPQSGEPGYNPLPVYGPNLGDDG